MEITTEEYSKIKKEFEKVKNQMVDNYLNLLMIQTKAYKGKRRYKELKALKTLLDITM